MATWQEVQESARKAFHLDVDKADEFAVTVQRTDLSEPRAQRVMVRRYTAWSVEMVEFRSAFGEIGSDDGRALLADSLKLPMGSIALHGRFLVVVHKVPLEHVSVQGILFLLTRIALLADLLEERRGGDRF